ncbi:MAG: TspO/MBR family protein [Anaerolineales bacterium]|jgi:tryptophan-rich sensory protein
MNLTRSKDILLLVGCIVVPFVIGGLGGWITTGSLTDWYSGLQKPSWNPPSAVFGPVWSFLYLLMGIALWRIMRMGWGTEGVQPAVIWFAVQLVLNFGWSLIFFGLRAPGPALIEILVLLAAVLITTRRFYVLEPAAGWLLVPYILWAAFATVLNGTIWRLNS